eukprot:contig_11824_g2814
MTPFEATPRVQALVAAGNTLKAAVATVAADTGLWGPALATAYRRHRTDAGSANGNAVLSKEQEQLLVGVVQAFSIDNLPLSLPQLQALVNNRFGATVSREWVSPWLARHRAHLSLRACRTLAGKRAGPQVYFGVQGFCLELRVFLDRHHFSPDCVFNYDETRFVQLGGNLVSKRIDWLMERYFSVCTLFGDQLGAHTQAQVIEQCMARAVFLFFLTPNSSHFNQPLDAYPFAPFEGYFTRTNEQGIMDCVLASTNARDSLLLVACTAEVMDFTSDAIVGSFRLCGLWPFSPATMLQRAKDNL